MKNTLPPIIIFLCLIFFVYFANSSLIALCDTLTESTNEIEDLLEERDFETAKEKAEDIVNLIDEKTVITAVYINHSDFDNLMDEAHELCLYTKCEDYMESLIAVNSLKEFAKNIKHLHETNIENIF